MEATKTFTQKMTVSASAHMNMVDELPIVRATDPIDKVTPIWFGEVTVFLPEKQISSLRDQLLSEVR